MDDTQSTSGDDAGRQSDDIGHDQDSEPTMNAPQGRPDGLDALTEGDEDDEATGGDGTPS